MINAAIIESKAIYAEHLKLMLLRWADGEKELSVSVYLENFEIFSDINSNISDFDIVFIDLALKCGEGIKVAKRLRRVGFKNTIVLISDCNDGAIEGYRVNAYRYYLKPIQPRDVKECMDYVLDKSAGDYFRYTYHGTSGRIAFADIRCFESREHYVDIYAVDKTVHIKGILKDIQKQCPSWFIRCQRSYIVNSRCIKEKRGRRLVLDNNKIIDISPKYMDSIADIIKNGRQPWGV